jgi:hypothetical protein
MQLQLQKATTPANCQKQKQPAKATCKSNGKSNCGGSFSFDSAQGQNDKALGVRRGFLSF